MLRILLCMLVPCSFTLASQNPKPNAKKDKIMSLVYSSAQLSKEISNNEQKKCFSLIAMCELYHKNETMRALIDGAVPFGLLDRQEETILHNILKTTDRIVNSYEQINADAYTFYLTAHQNEKSQTSS